MPQTTSAEAMKMEKAINWIRNILATIPESIRDKSIEISEQVEDLETIVSRFDEEGRFDENLANQVLTDLKTSLQETVFKGKAIHTRDKIVNMIIIPSGWKYWVPTNEDYLFTDISFQKGNEKIQYKSVKVSDKIPLYEDNEGIELIKGKNEKLEWEMFRVQLDSNPSIYFASIPAWQLDLCSSVPALEKKITHREVAKRVENPKRKKNNWQRQLNQSNKNSISAFFDNEATFFANPVILHLPDTKFVEIETDESSSTTKVTIDMKFAGNQYFENMSSFDQHFEDQRPFTIIDGQHRIRGAANSRDSYQQRILVVLLPPSMSEDVSGRLFAEINTLSRPLNDKHRMFLAHRFKVASPDPKFTFGHWDEENLNTHRDRANRYAYEMAARLLYLSTNGFWTERIKFLNENVRQQQVIDIEKYVEYTYGWFLNYPYTINNIRDFDDDDIFFEIDNYFGAWKRILGDYWDESKVDGCLFKSKTQSRVLLTRFPQVYEKALEIQENGIITEDTFYSIISPTKNLPFTHESILSAFSSALPEESWKHLDAWVKDAISHGDVRTREDILNKDIRGEPGAGILALPIKNNHWHIVSDENGLDPSDGETRYLVVRRPTNCGYTCKPEIWHDGSKLSTSITVKAKKVEDEERIPIRNRYPLPEYDNDVKLRIVWSTISGEQHIDISIR